MSSTPSGSDQPQPGLRRAVLFCNSKSRRGREWYPAVDEALRREGFELLASRALRDPSQMLPLVQQAVRDKVPLIIVGGGDGTMSATASALKGSESIMGVLPLGTGNAFARDLGVPSDVEGACRILIDGAPRRVDLGIANGKHFVNVATVGLTTRIAEALDDGDKKRLGRFVYALAIMKAVGGLKPFEARITEDDRVVHRFQTMQVVFGSGRFHAGPFPVTPDAEIDDHFLHGYALKGTSKAALLKYALHLWGGRHVDLPEVEAFTIRRGRLETVPRKQVVLDGELMGKTPVDVAIDPGAITVMAARDFPGSGESPRSNTAEEVLLDAPVKRG